MVKSIWKNILLFVGLILLIVGFHIFSINTLDRYVTTLCQQGEKLISLVQNEQYEEARQNAEIMEKQWEKHGRHLCFFIDHEDVEEIGHMIAKVQSDLQEETWALAITEVEEIMAKARDIYKREKLTLENIF